MALHVNCAGAVSPWSKLASTQTHKVLAKTILISGSPGLVDEAARRGRRESDAHLAGVLSACEGDEAAMARFLGAWYRQPLFDSLREHPLFEHSVLGARMQSARPRELARSLCEAGAGSMPNMWPDLSRVGKVVYVCGELDRKFVTLSSHLTLASGGSVAVEVVPGCGHAVHLEAPRTLLGLLHRHMADSL